MTVTSKQKKIADLVAKGLNNSQIATELGNTQGGIEQHLVKIYRRLKVASRGELANIAHQLKVLDGRRRIIREVTS